jgi:predicted nucleotidyltransferase component of viral defense system
MLQESAAQVWKILSSKPELKGFVLIGGSALALHIDHRISEDLDFAWPYGRLPREALKKLIKTEPGLEFVLDQNEVALQEAEDAVIDLADHTQNYLTNGVRITFFSSYEPEKKLLARDAGEPLRVATVPEIFALKALASADRSKTRDWFDLYTLFKFHGFTWNDFHDVFPRLSTISQYQNAAGRLCSGRPQANDEGYETLVAKPPSVREMRDYFLQLREAYERGREKTSGA